MIVFPHMKPFDESQPKPKWYREHEYCEYHNIQGHSANRCLKFKLYVQNLIKMGHIKLAEAASTSSNHKPTSPATNPALAREPQRPTLIIPLSKASNNQSSPSHQSTSPTSNPTPAPEPRRLNLIPPLSKTPNSHTSRSLSSNYIQLNPN